MMSTKRIPAQADEPAVSDQATSALASPNTTAPSPDQAPVADEPDSLHGQGGHYTVGEDGVRRLVQRTSSRK